VSGEFVADAAPLAPIWVPDPGRTKSARITDFAQFVSSRTGRGFDGYRELWSWSVGDPPGFWSAVWDYFAVSSDEPPGEVLAPARLPGARWFPGTRVNYAEHALAPGPGPAVIEVTEDGRTASISRTELRRAVGAFSRWLLNQGVQPGERVVGYLPNTSHAVIAFLATASIGAVWSACGQDYSAAGAAARFDQLDPVVLVAADGYCWNGRVHHRLDAAAELRHRLPTVRAVVQLPIIGDTLRSGFTAWDACLSSSGEPTFRRVDFDSRLWVHFSSGTTGPPKGIVHGHGGVLIDHLRLLGLHFDLGAGDRFLWYTTTNWMMWNLVVSGLLVGATCVLYDGSPTGPDPQRLFALAAEHRVAVLGVSPGYLHACAKAGLCPGRDLDLGALRILGSTGAPLPPDTYAWVRDRVGEDVQVSSITGGTDVVSGFAGSAPTTPVWAGEISAPLLGVDLQAWGPDGAPVIDEVGELVVVAPLPSMPLGLWGDSDGARYRDTYFSTYPGAWRHGDWVTMTGRGTIVVSGRSDSTLNRHGVRLGSAEIYAVVEQFPEVREALVLGVEIHSASTTDYWMPLFLVLEAGIDMGEDLRDRIMAAIATDASPRHVPDEVIAVPAIPHTRTGKKLEVPLKRLIQGGDPEQIINPDAVDDMNALLYFTRFVRTTEANI
jgi:acetoacetyl-CoA synthetase